MISMALVLGAMGTLQYFASMTHRSVGEKITFGISWTIAIAASLLGIVTAQSMDITTLFEPNLGRFMHTVYENWLK